MLQASNFYPIKNKCLIMMFFPVVVFYVKPLLKVVSSYSTQNEKNSV